MAVDLDTVFVRDWRPLLRIPEPWGVRVGASTEVALAPLRLRPRPDGLTAAVLRSFVEVRVAPNHETP